MAITGDKYCTSAWNGFLVNLKHISQYYIAMSLASGFIFIGIVLITLLNCGVFTGLLISKTFEFDREIIPALYVIVIIISMVSTMIFFNLFDKVVISTLHCMALDMEVNGGRPHFGPPSFHDKLKEIAGSELDGEYEEAPQTTGRRDNVVHPINEVDPNM